MLRGLFGRTPLAFPNLYLPIWQIEGLAAWEESALTGEGRLRASDFRAIAQESARAGRVAPLDRVNGGLTAWPDGFAPYAYGLGFHQFEYAIDRDRPPRRLTNLPGGAMWPDVSPDGRTIVFVGYTPDGFDVFTTPYLPQPASASIASISAAQPLSVSVAQPFRAAEPPADLQTGARTDTYSPWPTLRPTCVPVHPDRRRRVGPRRRWHRGRRRHLRAHRPRLLVEHQSLAVRIENENSEMRNQKSEIRTREGL